LNHISSPFCSGYFGDGGGVRWGLLNSLLRAGLEL
jgi:hypothetical protein